MYSNYISSLCFHTSFSWNKYIEICDTISVNKLDRVFRNTQSLLQRWLREEHNISVESKYDVVLAKNSFYWTIYDSNTSNTFQNRIIHDFKTYESALEKGIYEALKLIK